MATRIYGANDDLVEVEGDVTGEVGHFATDEDDAGTLVLCSDGTMLQVKYGKLNRVIWGIAVIRRGELFDRIDPCDDEDATPYSDQAYFKDGLTWAYAATTWQAVK